MEYGIKERMATERTRCKQSKMNISVALQAVSYFFLNFLYSFHANSKPSNTPTPAFMNPVMRLDGVLDVRLGAWNRLPQSFLIFSSSRCISARTYSLRMTISSRVRMLLLGCVIKIMWKITYSAADQQETLRAVSLSTACGK